MTSGGAERETLPRTVYFELPTKERRKQKALFLRIGEFTTMPCPLPPPMYRSHRERIYTQM